jgi:hypothetical protein
MSAETTFQDNDPLEALWAIKWSEPDKLQKPRTTLNDENPSAEFRERTYLLVTHKK